MPQKKQYPQKAPEAPEMEIRDSLLPFLSSADAAKRILAQIESDGYVVLPGVFSLEEIDTEYKRMWDWVQTVVPSIKKNNPNTWKAQGRNDPWPCSQRDMMQLHQAGWVFSGMREAMAERVFETVYGTRELHCSKDGFTLQRPTEDEMGRSLNDHYDQGFLKRGLQCIQGSIALTDQEHDDGCFSCWPGSHRLHDEMMDWRGPGGAREDFVILNPREHAWLREQGIEPKRVPVKRGDVILWRSDLVHKGAPPIGRRDNFRAVVYVCMLPAALTPEHVYSDKLAAYEQIQTGCHWPNREEWFHPKRHHATVKPYFMKPPELSLRQRQLYGLVRYDAEEGTDEVGAPKGKASRRWGRNHAAYETQESIGGYATSSSAPPSVESEPQQPCSDSAKYNASYTSAEQNDGHHVDRDLRRVQKALREIEALEVRRDSGEPLRKNQLDKLAKKETYEQELERLTAVPSASGGA